jgi:hypothetical protein
MRSRTIAIAGSIAALSLAALPVAQAKTTAHSGARPAAESRSDRSRDASGKSHADKSRDTRSEDSPRDLRAE